MFAKPRLTAAAATVAVVSLGACAAVEDARSRWVQAPSRCDDTTVQIYFEPDSIQVSPEGRAVIQEAAAEARGCVVQRVEVLGLADAAGAPEPNLELSRRRAQSVTAALASAGLPPAEFLLAGAGQSGAVSENGAEPLRRRADVILRLRPAS